MKINASTVIQACSMNAFVQKISDSITHHSVEMDRYKKFKIVNGKPLIILQCRYTWLYLVFTEPLFIHRSLTIVNYCFQEFNHSIIRPCQTSILSRHGTQTEKIDRFAGFMKTVAMHEKHYRSKMLRHQSTFSKQQYYLSLLPPAMKLREGNVSHGVCLPAMPRGMYPPPQKYGSPWMHPSPPKTDGQQAGGTHPTGMHTKDKGRVEQIRYEK